MSIETMSIEYGPQLAIYGTLHHLPVEFHYPHMPTDYVVWHVLVDVAYTWMSRRRTAKELGRLHDGPFRAYLCHNNTSAPMPQQHSCAARNVHPDAAPFTASRCHVNAHLPHNRHPPQINTGSLQRTWTDCTCTLQRHATNTHDGFTTFMPHPHARAKPTILHWPPVALQGRRHIQTYAASTRTCHINTSTTERTI